MLGVRETSGSVRPTCLGPRRVLCPSSLTTSSTDSQLTVTVPSGSSKKSASNFGVVMPGWQQETGPSYTGFMSSTAPYGPDDIRPGDWIKYRSEYYGTGRLAEVHGLGSDSNAGPYAVTVEGNVLLSRILEVRRRPLEVLVFPAGR